MDKNTQQIINKLLYLRGQLDNVIDTAITEDVFKGRFSVDGLVETLNYRIEENIRFMNNGK